MLLLFLFFNDTIIFYDRKSLLVEIPMLDFGVILRGGLPSIMNYIGKIILSFIAVFVLFPVIALSSERQMEREELLFWEIPKVITATKTVQSLPEAPATVVVITRAQIKHRGYRNLLDLLKDMPGVDVQDRCCQETYNSIAMRGIFKQEKIIIMMDGHRISSPTGEKLPIAENFPLYNARQVEIVYGPASALYGADAFAGVINIITEDPDRINGLDLTTAAGSFGYKYGHFNFGGKLSENTKISLAAHSHSSDNADLPDYYDEYKLEDIYYDHDHNGGTADVLLVAGKDRNFDMGTKSHTGFLKLDINDEFTLGYSRSFFRHPSGQGSTPDKALFDNNVKWETLVNNYYADYNFKSGRNLSGESSLSYLTYEVLPGSKFINNFTNFENTAYKYANGKRFKIEQQLNYEINEKNTIVGGISFEDFYALPKTFDLTNEYDRDLSSDEQGFSYAGTNESIPMKIYELRYKNYGAYLQLQSSLNEIISATLGARYDENSRYGDTFNPRLGFVVEPAKNTRVKLLYGEASQAPSPFNAYAGFGAFESGPDIDGDYVGGYFHLPNHDLKPEKLRTYELGLHHSSPSRLTVSANIFYTEIDDLILDSDWYTTTNTTAIEGGKINPWKRKENIGEANYYGGELSLDFEHRLSGINMRYWINYSYVDGRQQKEGYKETEHQSIAKNKIKSGLTASYGNFYITPAIKWIGRTNNRLVLSTSKSYSKDERTVDDYVLVNLHMGLNELVGGLSTTLNIQNLLDKRYYNNGEGSQRFLSMPQEPRRIVFSLNYKF